MSELDYFRCEVCGAQLMSCDAGSETKFPAVRRFADPDERKGLLSVRCAECVRLPYKIEEGQPFRSDLIGNENVTIASGCNSVYNYWPNVGHLLEVYISSPTSTDLEFLRTAPIEIGFLVQEEVNLIVIAYRFATQDWNVTPFLWHAYPKSQRAVPPENVKDSEKFTVATVDTDGGVYRTVRVRQLPQEFAAELNGEIKAQILRGEPDGQAYHASVAGLWRLLVDKKVASMLRNTALFEAGEE